MPATPRPSRRPGLNTLLEWSPSSTPPLVPRNEEPARRSTDPRPDRPRGAPRRAHRHRPRDQRPCRLSRRATDRLVRLAWRAADCQRCLWLGHPALSPSRRLHLERLAARCDGTGTRLATCADAAATSFSLIRHAAALGRCWSTQLRKAGAGSAPVTRATSLPWSISTRVGMLRMPNRRDRFGASSLLTLTSLSRPGSSVAIF